MLELNELTKRAIEIGNKDILLNDNLFYFGERRSGSTFNMLLKGIITGLNSGTKNYRIGYVVPTLNMSKPISRMVLTIADKLGLKIGRCTSRSVTVKFNELSVTVDFFSTEDQSRGRDDNMIIVDEPEHLKNKRSFFRSLLVSGKDYMIGGESPFGSDSLKIQYFGLTQL